jgi:predicted component of type VI protein secretion system
MAAERVYVFLVVRKEGKPKKVIVWDTPDISVGRAPENDVVVEDAEASREHATFYRSDAGHSVRNQSMSNQTLVNGEPVNSHPLQTKDVVKIAETEFLFFKAAKNPVTLGLPVEYASQLKGFGPKVSGDGEATILGLVEMADSDEEFVVRPARDFDHELNNMEPPKLEAPKPRNLDLEIASDGLDDLDLPPAKSAPAPPAKSAPGAPAKAAPAAAAKKPAAAAWSLDDDTGNSGSVSLTLEIEGLTPQLRAQVAALLGKVIELPRLRVKVKGRDLG